MSSDALAPALRRERTAPAWPASVAALARREGPILLALAAFAVVIGEVMPLSQIRQDSWMTFVSGREILDHGLHARESLTVLTQGKEWVDQQWLAQVGYYGLVAAGGLTLAMLFHFVLLLGSFGGALAVARRRGASPLAAGCVGALSLLLLAAGSQLRSQNFAYPLFVAVLALLVLDRGRLSYRLFWTLPLLALWANLHGSVLVGVALVLLYAGFGGMGALREPDRARRIVTSGALAAGAAACIFASPYGLSLVDYYRSILANGDIKTIMEWRPITQFGQAYIFYVVLAPAVYLVARYRSRLQPFEIAVLVFTAAAPFQAVRNIVWFGYAALVILPFALDGTRPMRPRTERRTLSPSVVFAPVAVAVIAMTLITAATRSSAWYESDWSPAALSRVSAAVQARPATRIWATERFADWLVWKDSALAGHIAYDARLELLAHPQFREVIRFKAARGPRWHAVVDGYDLVVLENGRDQRQISALTARRGETGTGRPVLYRDDFVTVLGRSPRA